MSILSLGSDSKSAYKRKLRRPQNMRKRCTTARCSRHTHRSVFLVRARHCSADRLELADMILPHALKFSIVHGISNVPYAIPNAQFAVVNKLVLTVSNDPAFGS
jgi:hypothetical protein